MDSVTEFAKMFRERENKHYAGPQIGVVVELAPYSIKISLDNQILLTKKQLIIPDKLINATAGVFQLQLGDEVILIPSTDEQIYFLIDKVVRI